MFRCPYCSVDFARPPLSKLKELRVVGCPNCGAELELEKRLENINMVLIFGGGAITVMFLLGHPVQAQHNWIVGLVAAFYVVHWLIERWQVTHPRLRVATLGTPEKKSVS